MNPGDALAEARSLVRFLQEVTRLEHQDGDLIEALDGHMLVYDLILDKIEIGFGVYHFPVAGDEKDLPRLAEREGW